MSITNYDELARRACTDETAFEELYEHFFPRVYNFIFARLKNSADADDVTSVVFMKMNESLDNFNPSKAAFSTWLFHIASNAVVDHVRKTNRRQETEWDDNFEPTASVHNEPESKVVADENSRELMMALDTLSDRERRIVELKFFAELNSKSIAEIMSMSESNVRVTLHRTLDKLRKQLIPPPCKA